MSYYQIYLKYKTKYLQLKHLQSGGDQPIITNINKINLLTDNDIKQYLLTGNELKEYLLNGNEMKQYLSTHNEMEKNLLTGNEIVLQLKNGNKIISYLLTGDEMKQYLTDDKMEKYLLTRKEMEKYLNPIYGMILCYNGFISNNYFLKDSGLINTMLSNIIKKTCNNIMGNIQPTIKIEALEPIDFGRYIAIKYINMKAVFLKINKDGNQIGNIQDQNNRGKKKKIIENVNEKKKINLYI